MKFTYDNKTPTTTITTIIKIVVANIMVIRSRELNRKWVRRDDRKVFGTLYKIKFHQRSGPLSCSIWALHFRNNYKVHKPILARLGRSSQIPPKRFVRHVRAKIPEACLALTHVFSSCTQRSRSTLCHRQNKKYTKKKQNCAVVAWPNETKTSRSSSLQSH